MNVNDNSINATSNYTPKDILSNVSYLQGPNMSKPIQDGISGKKFANIDELLNYYGYAGVEE